MKFKQTINFFSAWTVDRLTSARRATLTMLATFLIAMTAQTAWAQDPATIGSISYNSTLGAYEINSVENLKDLAVYVYGSGNYSTTGSETTPHDCYGLTFKMTDNIAFTHTTAWNAESSSEDNFTPIGGYDVVNSTAVDKSFNGTFDGNFKTISGIRMNSVVSDGNTYYRFRALFGRVGQLGMVKNVILADTRISGVNFVAGIVGEDYGEVTNCHVTSTVYINAQEVAGSHSIGGIAGAILKGSNSSINNNKVTNCTSSATIKAPNSTSIGGIVGALNGELANNFVIGTTINTASGAFQALHAHGAIFGNKDGGLALEKIQNNYYYNCNIPAFGVEDLAGASPGYMPTTIAAGITTSSFTTITIPAHKDIVNSSLTDVAAETYTVAPQYHIIEFSYSGSGNTGDGYCFDVVDADNHSIPVEETSSSSKPYSFLMPGSNVTIPAPVDKWGVTSGANGSEANPYIISDDAGLNLLAQKVNAGNNYEGKYFKLNGDITYSYKKDWNVGFENNFNAIGKSDKPFSGHFDGNGKTISGIRIFKSGINYQGLFGNSNGDLKGITLADANIYGGANVGGIVGQDGGTVTNCQVANNVYVVATSNGGSIAGVNTGSITNCFVNSSTVSGTSEYIGAIVGTNSGTLTNNHYLSATLGGAGASGSTTGADVNGARKALTITTSDANISFVPTGTATTNNVLTTYADNNVIKYDDVLYSGAGESVSLTFSYTGALAEGKAAGYKVNDVAISGNSFTMPAADATITEVDVKMWGDGNGDSEATAYVITTTEGLDLLAQKVNAGTDYSGTYFKLGKDIEYDPTVLTIDNNGDSNADSNFTPIGNNTYQFKGTFDGNGKTISGININNSDATYQGVFGYLYGTVKNLVVSNCSIVAYQRIGAIAGKLKKGINESDISGTIENCIVSNVTLKGYNYIGGIAGMSDKGTIKGCVSAAAITGSRYAGNDANRLGGIVGATIDNPSSLTDNLFTGAITGDLGQYIGAIVGENPNGGLDNNLYTSTGLGGRGIASGSEKSTTGADGAGAHKAVEIIAAEGVTITPTGTKTTYNVSGITAYTDNNFIGYDSKLYAGATTRAKLSITYTVPEGYIFDGIDAGEGVNIILNEGVYNLAVPASGNVTISAKFKNLTMTLAEIEEFEKLAIDPTMQSYVENGALKLSVTPKNKFWTLACGVDLLLPEGIVVYKARMNSAGTKVDLTEISDSELNGVLKANNGVLIASTPGESYEFKVSPENSVTTLSTADAKSYGNDNQLVPVLEETHFDSENYFILTDNQFVMVDVSKDTKVPVGKAVLKVPAGTAQARAFGIDGYDTTGDTTGINAALENAGEEVWYNLQGQRISKPTRKGIYILNGKKVRM